MVISMGPVWYYWRHNIQGEGSFLPLAFFDLKEEIRYVRASYLIHALLITDSLNKVEWGRAVFSANADQITPNQYSPSLMNLIMGSGKYAKSVRGFWRWGGGRVRILQKGKRWKVAGCIGFSYNFWHSGELGIWAQGALRHFDLPVILTQHIVDLGIVTELYLPIDELLLRSLSMFTQPQKHFQSWSGLAFFPDNILSGIFLWKLNR